MWRARSPTDSPYPEDSDQAGVKDLNFTGPGSQNEVSLHRLYLLEVEKSWA